MNKPKVYICEKCYIETLLIGIIIIAGIIYYPDQVEFILVEETNCINY